MKADVVLRRAHRVIAILFLLAIPPAAYVSFKGIATSPLVYLPLFPLFALTLTGTYLLIEPWIRRWRGPRMT
jgi:hypothetical protein